MPVACTSGHGISLVPSNAPSYKPLQHPSRKAQHQVKALTGVCLLLPSGVAHRMAPHTSSPNESLVVLAQEEESAMRLEASPAATAARPSITVCRKQLTFPVRSPVGVVRRELQVAMGVARVQL